jgi:hypothetical protein
MAHDDLSPSDEVTLAWLHDLRRQHQAREQAELVAELTRMHAQAEHLAEMELLPQATVERAAALLASASRSSRRGRPAQAAYAVSGADFRQKLLATMQSLDKHQIPATQARVATAMHLSLRTLQNYCQRFGVDYGAVVRQVREA